MKVTSYGENGEKSVKVVKEHYNVSWGDKVKGQEAPEKKEEVKAAVASVHAGHGKKHAHVTDNVKMSEYIPKVDTEQWKQYVPKVDTEQWKQYVHKTDTEQNIHHENKADTEQWKQYVPTVDTEQWKQYVPKTDPDQWKKYLTQASADGKYNPKSSFKITLPRVENFNLFNFANITAKEGVTIAVKLPFPMNESILNKMGDFIRKAGGEVEIGG